MNNRNSRAHKTTNRLQVSIAMLIAGLLTVSTSSVPAAEALHDHDEIRASVKAYVEARAGKDDNTEIHVEHFDERLRLAKCSIKPEHYLPPGGKLEGSFVVGTRCNGDNRWAIFVPVKRLRYDRVAVTTRPLRRGELIGREHVEMRRMALNKLHSGYILHLDRALGKTARYRLAAGSILHSGNLEAAISVRRGEKVNILAKKGPIHVKMAGKALMDGAEGQRIRVKNQLSNRIVEGTVTYEGNVRVGR